MPTTKIAVFRKKEIRKTIHNNQWWFVIVDVVAALTDSARPDGYIKDMRRRDGELAKGWGQIATPLSVQTAGGGAREQLNSRTGNGNQKIQCPLQKD
jgi:prophage antirepressor-like protein